MFDDVERYLNGDYGAQPTVVETIRRLGEESARCLGVQEIEACVIGVDFAAYMLTRGFDESSASRDNVEVRLRRAAERFVYAARQSDSRPTLRETRESIGRS